jgi:hypothetical protein
MPGHALEVDHEEVKFVALQIGVREAARKFGLDEDTVKSWSYRESWFAKEEARERQIAALKQEKRVSQGLQPIAPTASEIIANYSGNTRLKLSETVNKQAENLAVRDSDELVLMASTVKTVIDGAAKLHGWEQGAQVTVNFDLISDNLHSIPIVDTP